MAAPNTGTAAPWCAQSDIPARYAPFLPGGQYPSSPALITAAIQVASDVLFDRTARRWGGQVSNMTVRPCSRRVNDGSPRPIYGVSGTGSLFGYFGGIANAPWIAAWGYCTCVADVHRGCNCQMVPEITLGVYPLVSVSQVTVDGVTYPGPAGAPGCTYRVDDYRYLVRTDGSVWPCCQDVTLDTSQSNTWSVTLTGGVGPPVGGVKAAGMIAGELLAVWGNPSSSQLSPRTKDAARQGLTVNMIDPEAIFGQGLTGIPPVDLWIKSVNPLGIQRRATVSSVDRPRPVRRAGTG